jgi:hypothetical protein
VVRRAKRLVFCSYHAKNAFMSAYWCEPNKWSVIRLPVKL